MSWKALILILLSLPGRTYTLICISALHLQTTRIVQEADEGLKTYCCVIVHIWVWCISVLFAGMIRCWLLLRWLSMLRRKWRLQASQPCNAPSILIECCMHTQLRCCCCHAHTIACNPQCTVKLPNVPSSNSPFPPLRPQSSKHVVLLSLLYKSTTCVVEVSDMVALGSPV